MKPVDFQGVTALKKEVFVIHCRLDSDGWAVELGRLAPRSYYIYIYISLRS
jgi:hypothetical protein